jgi:hypothetical protein
MSVSKKRPDLVVLEEIRDRLDTIISGGMAALFVAGGWVIGKIITAILALCLM